MGTLYASSPLGHAGAGVMTIERLAAAIAEAQGTHFGGRAGLCIDDCQAAKQRCEVRLYARAAVK